VRDDDAALITTLRDELQEGVQFLALKGHPGATFEVSGPGSMEDWTAEIGARFTVLPDRFAGGVINLDPGRVGWRIEAGLSVRRDDQDVADYLDLGSAGGVTLEECQSWVRVLCRRAYVRLWEYLEGHHRGPWEADGGTDPHTRPA